MPMGFFIRFIFACDKYVLFCPKIPHRFEIILVVDKGSFNNYVDQILHNFHPPPPSSGQKWTFYILSTLCYVTHRRLSTDPPFLVYVVIE